MIHVFCLCTEYAVLPIWNECAMYPTRSQVVTQAVSRQVSAKTSPAEPAEEIRADVMYGTITSIISTGTYYYSTYNTCIGAGPTYLHVTFMMSFCLIWVYFSAFQLNFCAKVPVRWIF